MEERLLQYGPSPYSGPGPISIILTVAVVITIIWILSTIITVFKNKSND